MAFVEISVGYQGGQCPLIPKGISGGLFVPSGPCACLTHLGEPLNVRVWQIIVCLGNSSGFLWVPMWNPESLSI